MEARMSRAKQPRSVRIQINVTKSLQLRFAAGVAKSDADKCWPWIGAMRNGYGAIKHEGKVVGAHVVAFVIAHGPVPDGLLVTHECDNRACCNPAHLTAGSNSKNVRDFLARRNPRLCRGEMAYNAVLNEDLVRKIRAMFKPRVFSYRRIAKALNLNINTVRAVTDGDAWKHVV